MKIVGYSDRFSVQSGQMIRFMVSSQQPSYRADVVRLIHSDANPAGPGFKCEEVETSVTGEYQGRTQTIHSGSYVIVPHQPLMNCTDGLTLQAWIFPTTPHKGVQGVLTKWSAPEQAGYSLVIDDEAALALWIGSGNGQAEKVRTDVALKAFHWYFVAATYDAPTGTVCLYQEPLSQWPMENSAAMSKQAIRPRAVGVNTDAFLMAAYWQKNECRDAVTTAHFNGKIDSPRLFGRPLDREQIEQLKVGTATSDDSATLGRWDFSLDISSQHVEDTSPRGLHGRAVNMPTRAVTGHNWTGYDVDFKTVPTQYGAVHFHDDDLEDARWDVDFEWSVPDRWPSGVYAARLSVADAEDYIPFVVTPKRTGPRADIAFLIPTVTYLAYANQQFNDPLRDVIIGPDRQVHGTPHDRYIRDHKLLSLYDLHSDGTGVCYSSRLRPILNLRPQYRMPESSLAATWPHLLNADLHLLDWLNTKSFKYDLITDDDLHLEGTELLEPYRVIITAPHPEYWTSQMFEGLEAYLANGGRLMYLGGNGFYWVTSFDPQRPHIIEIRRWGGTRCWEAAPGEYYHSTTGEIGGLWRFRNRAPQKLLGVGFTSMGSGQNRPYRRQSDSHDPRAAFIFEGIGEDELIGEFPSLVLEHGAAGFEIDRLDHTLGTPDHALWLASSSGHSDRYQLAIEDQLASGMPTGGSESPLVRADMVYFEGPKRGAVFSVGSISWCGCLSYSGYDNNVSRITENVLRRFAACE